MLAVLGLVLVLFWSFAGCTRRPSLGLHACGAAGTQLSRSLPRNGVLGGAVWCSWHALRAVRSHFARACAQGFVQQQSKHPGQGGLLQHVAPDTSVQHANVAELSQLGACFVVIS